MKGIVSMEEQESNDALEETTHEEEEAEWGDQSGLLFSDLEEYRN